MDRETAFTAMVEDNRGALVRLARRYAGPDDRQDLLRGVVVLSDTSWNAIGGLGSLALHLVDDSLPLGSPRVAATPPQALLDGLVGDYQLQGMMKVSLRQRDGRLFAQAEGQPEFELAYDSAGDFHPLAVDALLRPQRKADGSHAFTWMQGGGVVPATRLAADGAASGSRPRRGRRMER